MYPPPTTYIHWNSAADCAHRKYRWLGWSRIHLQHGKTQIRTLGWEDPLEKEMATHSSIPAWRIPWTEGPGGLQSMGS